MLHTAASDPRTIALVVVVAARLSPVIALAPLFGGRRALRVKLAVTAVLVFAALPLIVESGQLAGALSPSITGTGWRLVVHVIATVVGELTVGAFFGFVAALPVYAVYAAGALADHGRPRPAHPDRHAPLAEFSTLLAIVVFVAVDGHVQLVGSLLASYQAIPIGGLSLDASVATAVSHAVAAVGKLIVGAVGLAAPVLAARFLCDVAVGLVQRAADRVGTADVRGAVRALAGNLALLLALWVWAVHFVAGGDTLGETIDRAARIVSGR